MGGHVTDIVTALSLAQNVMVFFFRQLGLSFFTPSSETGFEEICRHSVFFSLRDTRKPRQVPLRVTHTAHRMDELTEQSNFQKTFPYGPIYISMKGKGNEQTYLDSAPLL